MLTLTPSRVSFLSGLYPSTAHGNINGNARPSLPERARLITRRFADAGYACGLSGKLHLASAWRGVEERADDGYSRVWYSHAPCQGIDQGNQYTDWLRSIGRYAEVIDDSRFDPAFQSGARYRENVPPELHQTISWSYSPRLFSDCAVTTSSGRRSFRYRAAIRKGLAASSTVTPVLSSERSSCSTSR